MGRLKDPNKPSESLIQSIKDAVSRVNSTLNNYEANYVSATRTSDIVDKESCDSLQDFIEIRFNRECLNVPELREAVESSNGHLFICKELINEDPATRRFDQALVTLISEDDIESEVNKIISKRSGTYLSIEQFRSLYPELISQLTESLRHGMRLAKSVLKGCDKFRFNSVKKKIKLTNFDNKKL